MPAEGVAAGVESILGSRTAVLGLSCLASQEVLNHDIVLAGANQRPQLAEAAPGVQRDPLGIAPWPTQFAVGKPATDEALPLRIADDAVEVEEQEAAAGGAAGRCSQSPTRCSVSPAWST